MVTPSPKFHDHRSGPPVLRSVKFALKPSVETSKLASGIWATVTTSVTGVDSPASFATVNVTT